jgi:hypothetical protein
MKHARLRHGTTDTGTPGTLMGHGEATTCFTISSSAAADAASSGG